MFDPAGPVLGIDPGLSRCGYGAVHHARGRSQAVSYGELRTDPGDELPGRLAALAADLAALITELRPSALAVERVLFQANVRTAIAVGQASGLALATAASVGIPVAHYSPNEVKLAVTGSGAADKRQVQAMVTRLLALDAEPPPDAADALALALCHSWSCRAATRFARGRPIADAGRHRSRPCDRRSRRRGSVLRDRVGAGNGDRALRDGRGPRRGGGRRVSAARPAQRAPGLVARRRRVPVHASPCPRRRTRAVRVHDPRRARHIRDPAGHDRCRAQAGARDPVGALAGRIAPRPAGRRRRCAHPRPEGGQAHRAAPDDRTAGATRRHRDRPHGDRRGDERLLPSAPRCARRSPGSATDPTRYGKP